MADWIDIRADEQHIARERAKAKKLRESEWWQAQLRKGVCHYCGKHVGAENLTMDHVIPVARGGTSTKGNIVPCCFACNQGKGFYTPAELILQQLENEGQLPEEEGLPCDD